VMFLLSLVLPICMAPLIWALHRATHAQPPNPVLIRPIPIMRHAPSVLLPLFAIASYTFMRRL